ncbi:hypothetical protein [Methylocystis parvus]|uniref:DUF992 domain-containing protein n=1 Tax=Methylocystis parvus TaxID=134 RepID=A0A6B8M2A8_9HYPH|nr:hypothetical protein [Methylocystis parvus]QGM98987.1 hypothetical protein F7D14_16845 [Methylocystis parvus]WBK00653.1 hypothetical protein MMG94_02690 [Methylocystis parvus OBBP]
MNKSFLAILLASTMFFAPASVTLAHAENRETRKCEFEAKKRCASGEAAVTLVDGAVTNVQIEVFWCGRPGAPGYSCMIDVSRGDKESKWSEEGGATLIDNAAPFNPQAPDRVKITLGKFVSIDLENAQSLGRCGAGAELPKAIVVPARKALCRVWLDPP